VEIDETDLDQMLEILSTLRAPKLRGLCFKFSYYPQLPSDQLSNLPTFIPFSNFAPILQQVTWDGQHPPMHSTLWDNLTSITISRCRHSVLHPADWIDLLKRNTTIREIHLDSPFSIVYSARDAKAHSSVLMLYLQEITFSGMQFAEISFLLNSLVTPHLKQLEINAEPRYKDDLPLIDFHWECPILQEITISLDAIYGNIVFAEQSGYTAFKTSGDPCKTV